METIVISTICITLSLTMSVIAITVGLKALISVKALQLSTHNVQYVPIDPETDRENKKFIKEQQSEEWATTDEAISKQNKLHKEDMEDYMPEFATDEDDRKIHSF